MGLTLKVCDELNLLPNWQWPISASQKLSCSFESWLTRPSRHLSPLSMSRYHDGKSGECSLILLLLILLLPPLNQKNGFWTNLLRFVSAIFFFFFLRNQKMSTCGAHDFWLGLLYVVYFSKEDEEWKEFEQREVDYSGLRLQALQIRWGKKSFVITWQQKLKPCCRC